MGFFDAVGNMANKAKLSGEIALIDRDLDVRKRAFGVELFDLIKKQQKQNEHSLFETPDLFKTIANEIREPMDKYSKEIHIMELEKKQCETDMELMEARKIRNSSTGGGGMGNFVADATKGAELNIKITYLDREIRLRKEAFGIEIWDAVSQVQWLHEAVVSETKDKSGLGMVTGAVGGLAKGVKGTVTKTIGMVSSDERAIEACVNKAKDDIKHLEESKSRKQKEIDAIP